MFFVGFFWLVVFFTQVTAKIPGTSASRPLATGIGVCFCSVVFLMKNKYLPLIPCTKWALFIWVFPSSELHVFVNFN